MLRFLKGSRFGQGVLRFFRLWVWVWIFLWMGILGLFLLLLVLNLWVCLGLCRLLFGLGACLVWWWLVWFVLFCGGRVGFLALLCFRRVCLLVAFWFSPSFIGYAYMRKAYKSFQRILLWHIRLTNIRWKQMHKNKQPKLRPHETQLILKILKTLKKNSKNTLAIYRELHQNTGFKNHHSFYRQLHFCLNNRLIELESVEKKWGIPTKKYRLTQQGQEMLNLLNSTLQPSGFQVWHQLFFSDFHLKRRQYCFCW